MLTAHLYGFLIVDVVGALAGLSHHTGPGGGGCSEDYRGTLPGTQTITTERGIAHKDPFIFVLGPQCMKVSFRG